MSEYKDWATFAAIQRLAKEDPGRARTWIACDTATGSNPRRSKYEFAIASAALDREVAQSWAEEISDEKLRTETLKQLQAS